MPGDSKNRLSLIRVALYLRGVVKCDRKSTRWKQWSLVIATSALAITFLLNVHDFLAIPTQRVDANILVVEGWIWDYGIKAAAEEFRRGGYTRIATSGFKTKASGKQNHDNASGAAAAASRLMEHGISSELIIPCAADYTSWDRTASSARAVRDKLLLVGIHIKGINVVTIGPHARQSWLAYRHTMDSSTPVGIITVPTQNFDPQHWWLTKRGIYAIIKDGLGWLREALFG